ncbi:MAG: hypothetical protein J6N52_08710 [Clostridia bacterium]|nr:hypothetical protein [Clostridia bacterium]
MKKISAILLALCIAGMQLTGIYAAEPAENEDALYFDMDLSEYDGDNRVVKNKVTDSADGITVYGRDDAYPEVDEISAVSGTTKYITTGQTASKGASYGVVQLDNSLAQPMHESDELTVEFWTRSDAPVSSYLYYKFFKLSLASYENSVYDDSIDWEMSVQSTVNAENRFARNSTNATDYAKVAVSNFPQKSWTHYVLTRTWDELNERYNTVVYINGAKKTSASGGKKMSAADCSMTIGGSGAASKTYQGSIGEFRVYLKALDADRARALYLDTKDNYADLPKSMKLVSPSGDMSVSPSEGHIGITFDNFIDKSTLDEITFTKKDDGSEAAGGIFIRTEEGNTRTADIYFGRLEKNSEYVLSIGAVKSINGYVFEGAEYTVKSNDTYLLNEDFSDWPIGEVSEVPEGSPLYFFSSGTGDSTADFAIAEATSKSTGKTIKYMEMKTRDESGAKDSYLAYNFSSGYTGDFVVEVGVRGQGGSALDRSIRFIQSGYMQLGAFLSGTNIYNGSGAAQTISSYNSSATDEFGFLNMVFTFRMNSEGTYTVTGVSPENPGLYYEAVTNYTSAAQIRGINQYHTYSEALTTEISHFRIYEYAPPEIIVTNLDKLSIDSDYVEITFNDDMTGFDNNTFCIKGAYEGTVASEFAGYDEKTRTARVKIKDYFDYNSGYVLSVKGIKNADGIPLDDTDMNFKVPPSDIYAVSTVSSSHINTAIKNNAKVKKNVLCITVCVDEAGKIVKTFSEKYDIGAASSADNRVDLASGVKKATVYVFECVDDEIRATRAKPESFDF